MNSEVEMGKRIDDNEFGELYVDHLAGLDEGELRALRSSLHEQPDVSQEDSNPYRTASYLRYRRAAHIKMIDEELEERKKGTEDGQK